MIDWLAQVGVVVAIGSKGKLKRGGCSALKKSMACIGQFDVRGREQGRKLDPPLKEFVDRVVVPILVQSYLSELQNEKHIAESATTVASCELMTDAPQAEVPR